MGKALDSGLLKGNAEGSFANVAMKIRHSLMVSLLVMVCASPSVAGETVTLRNGFSIHYQRREASGEITRLFLSDSADSFVDVPTGDILEIEQDITPAVSPEIPQQLPPRTIPHSVDLDEALSAASHHNNLSPELVRSVVMAESRFNPNARSGKGAQGLMQLMPQTAFQLGVKNAMDPVQNLEGGARYLSSLLDRYDNNLPIALAAYNAGPERVQQYHGIPPYPETIEYVNRILRDLYWPTIPSAGTAKQQTSSAKKSNPKKTHAVHSSKRAAKSMPDLVVPSASEATQGN